VRQNRYNLCILYYTLSCVPHPDSGYWYKHAQASLRKRLKIQPINENTAKNVIFFLGDGMSLPTITAARIFKGQLEGSPYGEEAELNFEKFPHVGLSKVVCKQGVQLSK